jgi:hypothetical protein
MMTDKDWRIAVIVDPSLSIGELSNTVAVLSIGLGAAAPMLAGSRLADGKGQSFHISANRPVPVLQACSEDLQALVRKALAAQEDGFVVPFPRFARQLHAFADYEAAMASRDIEAELLDGIGLAGPTKWIRSLTGSLKLLR